MSSLPADEWGKTTFSSIHAAVLFADFENSVVISSTLPPKDFDNLVNSFQKAMQQFVSELKIEGYPIGEVYIQGDQLSLFFYREEEAFDNYRLDGPDRLTGEKRTELIRNCRQRNESLLFSAMKAALLLKNIWLVQPFNITRAVNRREPFGLGIGLHWGNVFLRDRPDGRRRIEGYTVNLAKRIESSSRQGKFSHIMISEPACQTIRGSMRAHTQLRQRIFFQKHDFGIEFMKGITQQQAVYELKFFHRIGVHLSKKAVKQYETLFTLNKANIWSYYQLADYYAYEMKDWNRLFELATQAYIAHPHDEKVMLDLAKYYFNKGDLEQSREFCLQALDINPELDLVYEQLGEICHELGDKQASIEYLRKAVRLSPGSAVNQLNLGIALLDNGNKEDAARHINEAISRYPDYRKNKQVAGLLKTLKQ